MERVHRFRAMGRTMVIVSHGPERIRELCDRALVLERGKMLHVGSVTEAIETYRAALHDPSTRSMPSKDGAARTAQKTAASVGVDNDQPKPVSLLSAEVVDASAEVPFMPGEAVRIVVRYELIQPVDFRIRLALRSQDNMVMMNRSTSDVFDQPLPTKPGPVELRFTIDDLPLLDGTYRFAVVAETPDASHVFDRIIPQEAEFTVKGPDPAFGRVNMNVSGSIHPGLPGEGKAAKANVDLRSPAAPISTSR